MITVSHNPRVLLLQCRHFPHLPYSCNCKEAKDHGENGSVIDTLLKMKNVLVIDDVTTAGTAMRYKGLLRRVCDIEGIEEE